MSARDDDLLRERIGAILAGGLKTRTEPFPETGREFALLLDGAILVSS